MLNLPLLDPVTLNRVIARERMLFDWKLVLCSGCFDLLHPGHLRMLHWAKEAVQKVEGDRVRLLVALNSDARVNVLKGKGRPIWNLYYRAEMVGAIKGVDLLTHFEEDTPAEVIRVLRPDYFVKGAEYRDQALPEQETLEAYKVQLLFAPTLRGFSTTKLIKRCQGNEDDC